jgi:hypothetical protein
MITMNNLNQDRISHRRTRSRRKGNRMLAIALGPSSPCIQKLQRNWTMR